MTGRRGGRRKRLLDDLKEKRLYWKLKEEALDRTRWRTRFGRDGRVGYRIIGLMVEVDCNLTELAKEGAEMRDFVNTK